MKSATHASTDDALFRKITRRIVPFLFVCYVANYIDRVNIGFAKLQFLQDLKLNDAVYGMAAGIFFLSYMAFEVPSNLMLARIGVRKTLMRIMFLWGLFTVMLMFTKNATTLYVLRFLLGAAEAGFFPGIILYLTYWFPDARRGRVTSLFVIAIPLAGVIGGPLSGGIMSHFDTVMGLRGWQWLFLIEGVPAMVLGLMALFVLDDRPGDANWLSSNEKTRVTAALAADSVNASRGGGHSGMRDALRNPRTYLLAFIYFTIFMGLNAVSFWIPSIIRQVGVQNIGTIGLISGGISVCTAIGTLLAGYSSDRHSERRWHVAGSGFAVAAAFLLLPVASSSIPLTVALLVVASVGLYANLATFWTIPPLYLRGGSAAGGIAMITALGAIGGILSPNIVGTLKEVTGSLYSGLAVVACVMIIGMITLLCALPSARREADRAARLSALK
jgi:D-galactonate transporter